MHYPFPDNSDAYWLHQKSQVSYPSLNTDIEVDVAIVGGGIAGIVTAYILKQAGYTVAVVEKNRLANGTTGGTTGKVTSQHNLMYGELAKQHGLGAAKTHGAVYEQAIDTIEKIVKSEKIDCDWQRDDNYVYTTDEKRIGQFKHEAKIAAESGLPATYETVTELPFAIQAAVKFSHQAKFDAYKFTTQLAERVQDEHNFIFEYSKARRIVDGDQCEVATDKGRIIAKHIVVATLIPPSPMLARVGYAAHEYPETSYSIATTIRNSFRGMYISPDTDHYSLLPYELNGKHLLLVGGESHVPGIGHARPRLQKLVNYANEWFETTEILAQWGAMDYMAYDNVPIIGKMYPWSKNVYTITGLKKWGLSGAMVGALTVRDAIQKEESAATQLFTPQRLSTIRSIPKAAFKYFSK